MTVFESKEEEGEEPLGGVCGNFHTRIKKLFVYDLWIKLRTSPVLLFTKKVCVKEQLHSSSGIRLIHSAVAFYNCSVRLSIDKLYFTKVTKICLFDERTADTQIQTQHVLYP